MFVTNCRIETGELLEFPTSSKKRKKKKANANTEESEEKFHPVKCTECKTVVAVFDKDEVYHFFNVLASH